MEQIKIMLADSELLIREGFKSILSAEPRFEVVSEVENSEELRAALPEHHPDVLIIDYALRENFSIDDLNFKNAVCPRTKVLAITHDPQKEEMFKVLETGVSGFLLKRCDRNEIMSAVHATAKDEKFFCGKILDIILEKKMEDAASPCEPTQLTKREVEIVGMIASGQTNKMIADELCLSPHTVNTHRKNIMKKLNICSTAELVLYAINTSIIESPVTIAN